MHFGGPVVLSAALTATVTITVTGEKDMRVTLKAAEYAVLLGLVGFWSLAFAAACLVSRECRTIRAELDAEGEAIDPVAKRMGRLCELHVEFFGGWE